MKKGDNGEERVGMVVGLAMNSVQYFNEEHGYPREAAIPDEKMLAEGKKMAQEILKVIHQKEPETKKYSNNICDLSPSSKVFARAR